MRILRAKVQGWGCQLEKEFIVNKFLNFKMTDAKIAVSQVQEVQLILYDIYKKEMVLSESL